MNVRPYQREALERVRAELVEGELSRGLVTHPTGTGKGYLCRYLPEVLGSKRILFLAHREELLEQLYKHVTATVSPHYVGVEQGSRKAGSAPIVIASVPTLGGRGGARLRRIDPTGDRFEFVVVDEAHHGTATTYRTILKHVGLLDDGDRKTDGPHSTKLLGLTATPGRGDRVGLHNVFDEVLHRLSLREAIEGGWLVPVHAYSVQTKTSLEGVRVRRGDFVESELSRMVNTEDRNGAVLDAWERNTRGKKTLVFGVDVAHAEELAAVFAAAGNPARAVSGRLSKEERREAFAWFRETDGAVLTNCQLVTEGVDIPSIEAVIMARPTQSPTLYAQMLGRGTRLAEGAANFEESRRMGKDRVTVLDVVDGVRKVGRRAVNIADIFGAPLPGHAVKGENMLLFVDAQRDALGGFVAQRNERIDTELLECSLFSEPELPSFARFKWDRRGGGYEMSVVFEAPGDELPSGGFEVVKKVAHYRLAADELDRWVLSTSTGLRPFEEVGRWDSEREAMEATERMIKLRHPDSLKLIDRRAWWNSQEPSPKQLELARKLGLPVPPGATKGDVSRALDRFFTERDARKRARPSKPAALKVGETRKRDGVEETRLPFYADEDDRVSGEPAGPAPF